MNTQLVHALLTTLELAQSEEIERSLKQIKHLIVGHVAHKNLFLTHHVLRKLAALLSRDQLARDWRVLEAAVVVLGSITRARTDWTTHSTELFRLFDLVQSLLSRVAQSSDSELPKKETLMQSCCRTLSLLLQLDLPRGRTALRSDTLKLLAELLLFRPSSQHVARNHVTRADLTAISAVNLLARVVQTQHVTDFALAPEHVICCLDLLARDSITWTTRESLLHFLSLSCQTCHATDTARAWHVAFEHVEVIPILSRTLTTVALHSVSHTGHYQIRLDLCQLTAHIASLNVAGLSKNRNWSYFWSQIAHQCDALFAELPAAINSTEEAVKYLQQLVDVTASLCHRLPNLEVLLLENSLLIKVSECVQHVINSKHSSLNALIECLLKLMDHVLTKAFTSKLGKDSHWSSQLWISKFVIHPSVYTAVVSVLNMASDSKAQASKEIPLHCLLQLTRLGIRHVFTPHKTLLAQRTNQSEEQSREQSPTQLVTHLLDLAAKKGENYELVTRAISCVCNLVLEIRSLSHVLLEHDGRLLRQLIQLTLTPLTTPLTQLRLAGLWTLKNLVHESAPRVKSQVMTHVTWSGLCGLLHDSDALIQQHALVLTRNLVHKVTAEQFQELFPAAEFTEQLKLLLRKAKSPSVQSQVLYVCSNIAESYPQLLFEHDLVLPIMDLIDLTKPAEVLMAGLWCLVNLTWSAEDDTLVTRVKQLADTARIGFLDRLRQIRVSDSLAVDVQDRAKQVLDQLVLHQQLRD